MRLKLNMPAARRVRNLQAALLDIAITFIAYTIAYLVRSVASPVDYMEGVLPVLAVAILNVFCLYSFRAYRRIWQRTSGHDVFILVQAIGVAAVIVLALSMFAPNRVIPLSIIIVGQLLTLVGVVAVRFRSRLISGFNWRWRAVWRQEFPNQQTKVLIIGAGESGQALAWRMKHRFTDKRYQVVGFIDDDPKKQNMYVEGCRVLGTRDDILRVAEKHSVDLIVLAVHRISGASFRELLTITEKTKARIKVVPDLMALMNETNHAEPLRDVQVEDLIGRKTVERYEGIDLSPVLEKVVLVTGAAGSIGSELSRQLLGYEPRKLLLLDNNESGLHDLLTELQTRSPESSIVALLADICEREVIEQIFARYQPQVVFHAAAYKHVPMLEHFPSEAVRVNIDGTRNVAELARDYRAERFVLISTDKAVNPSSIMGATKRIGELMIHALSMQKCPTIYTAVRFGNVLNSRGSVVPTFERQIDSGGPVTITHPDMTRYFMSIPEAVNLILHAAAMTGSDDIFVLRMGEVVKIVELAERMIRMRGLRPNVDIEIAYTGIRPGEKLHEALFADGEVPGATAHPAIFRVKAWDSSFAVDNFWDDLRDLLSGDTDATLENLHQIMQPAYGAVES
jgi:FlaA1/EpsC-like NDP-sugar epimerase